MGVSTFLFQLFIPGVSQQRLVQVIDGRRQQPKGAIGLRYQLPCRARIAVGQLFLQHAVLVVGSLKEDRFPPDDGDRPIAPIVGFAPRHVPKRKVVLGKQVLVRRFERQGCAQVLYRRTHQLDIALRAVQ